MGRGHTVSKASTESRYSRLAASLHWIMALLLIAQLAMGFYMVELPKKTPQVGFFYNLHKSLGLVALMLVTVRLWVRLTQPAPALQATSVLRERSARLAHRLMYACMVLMPLSGFVGSNFGKYPVKFFGLALPQFGWHDPALQAFFRGMHVSVAWLLCGLIAVHLAAVAVHLSSQGGLYLRRMSVGR